MTAIKRPRLKFLLSAFFPESARDNFLFTKRLIFPLLFLVALSTVAKTALAIEQTENNSVVNTITSTEHSEDDNNRPSVEAGAGGGIALEKSHRTEAESLYSWHSHMLWESRYVSEGRDNLSGDGLFSLSSEFTIDDLTFIPWLAHSSPADYTELNLNLVYSTFVTEKLAASIGYTHLRFHDRGENSSDNEISLDLGYRLHQQLTVSAVVYHSFEADGSFAEFATSYYHELSDKVNYSVAVLLGANAGYIADGHDGLNNFQLLSTASYLPFDRLELYASASYNQAIGRDVMQYPGDETLKDFFWGGVGLVYLF